MLSLILGISLLPYNGAAVSTAVVAQGGIVSIRLELPSRRGSEPVVQALGQQVPCYEAGRKKSGWLRRESVRWQCWLGVPGDAPKGLKTVALSVDGNSVTAGWVRVIPSTFAVEALRLSDQKKTLLDQDTSTQVAKIRRHLRSETHSDPWREPFLQPVQGRSESPYGERRTVDGKLRKGYHRGVDWGARRGTPIRCAQDGTVVIAERFPEEGNMVAVDHGQGVITAYLHASKLWVKPGQPVKRGEVLSEVGSTGISNSNHLHFGVYIHDIPVDPVRWLAGYAPE